MNIYFYITLYQFWDVFASTKNNILVQTFAVYFQKS